MAEAHPREIRRRLDAMNAEIERLEREGRDLESLNLAARADALARQMYRALAAPSR